MAAECSLSAVFEQSSRNPVLKMSVQVSVNKPQPRATKLHRLASEFALLGLRTREARTDAIRAASKRVASKIRSAGVSQESEQAMLGELAASTYRLLDPRRRQKTAERVRLCVFSEADLDLQKRAAISWFTEAASAPVAVRPAGLSERLRSKASRAGSLGASWVAWLLAGSFLSSVACLLSR